ncbi:MAG: alanine racemase [Bacteroidetes bacterium]|nr:alanine racemase [Bacteroidota bacterium]MBL6944569.1 alanine racemase [Bacteroidales bacterium]
MKIKVPTLIIDQQKVTRNLANMVSKVERSSTIFRPHFKTHQSAEIGELFKQNGINCITVSSVSMALYFADYGWNDITIAFPVNIPEIDDINELASRVNLNILVESQYTVIVLSSFITHSLGIFIKIDTGYHRTGLIPDDPELDKIIHLLDSHKHLNFKGFLSHAGHTYSAKGKNEILKIMEDSKDILNKLKQNYIKLFPNIIISYGDTPSCSMTDNLAGFDEIRPGNFVYYDVMQYHMGSCAIEDIAIAVACPVVAAHPQRNELVIYGGAIHLSKEFIAADNDFRLFGYVVNFTKDGWSAPIPGAYVSSLSQEHGIIKMPEKDLKKFKPGDIIGVLPIHSCLAANLLRSNYLLVKQ